MTRVTITAAVCAAVLVVGAVALRPGQHGDSEPRMPSGGPRITRWEAAAPLVAKVSEAPSVQAGPLVAEDAKGALPVPDDEYVAAELPAALPWPHEVRAVERRISV